ncbi:MULTISPECIES: HD domain-containing protein [unclassified Streptomyces]|uniref:HD domain-containing protein n=1 Tax=unclassified Streptomyces TaxID=2593676 RepID=UPI000AB3A506|nr:MULTISPECIES: HD domain-containing protein [unclassified Streptomyces]AZM58872.1 phosphohydrolase [Streptomyces sp. WAC 01438]RSM93222.1 phosphohydrolase [Streptomyces sp. WAC 01420]
MKIPAPAEIRALHEKYAPTSQAFADVHTHCEIVWGVAERLLASPRLAHLDAGLVRAGCLLHDIGVYRLIDAEGRLDYPNYVRHGVLGHELLEQEGFPEPLRRFCSHHTGVGLTKDDVISRNLPVPPADYLAETPEERLVMYADKFHTKSRPSVFLTPDEYAEHLRRFGEDKVTAFQALRAEFGDPGLPATVPTG